MRAVAVCSCGLLQSSVFRIEAHSAELFSFLLFFTRSEYVRAVARRKLRSWNPVDVSFSVHLRFGVSKCRGPCLSFFPDQAGRKHLGEQRARRPAFSCQLFAKGRAGQFVKSDVGGPRLCRSLRSISSLAQVSPYGLLRPQLKKSDDEIDARRESQMPVMWTHCVVPRHSWSHTQTQLRVSVRSVC